MLGPFDKSYGPSKKGANFSSWPPFSIQCRFCLGDGDLTTANHIMSTHEWDFYNCYKCRSWFRVDGKNSRIVLMENKKMMTALNAYLKSSIEELEVAQEATSLIWRVSGRIWRFIDRTLFRRRRVFID